MNYNDFVISNRRAMNRSLFRITCISVLIGPMVAICTVLGFWDNISHKSCLAISLISLALVALQYRLTKHYGDTVLPGIVGLFAIDILMIFMANVHLGIHMTYFIVPLLSLFLCDRRFYLGTCAMNYIMMMISVWTISPYFSARELNPITTTEYFAAMMGGYTIETVCMLFAGLAICNYLSRNMKEIYDHQSKMSHQVNIMMTATDIYQNIHFMDFTNEFFVNVDGNKQIEVTYDEMKESLYQLVDMVVPSDRERCKEFLDLNTLRKRLHGKRMIVDEFYGMDMGYIRAEFAETKAGVDGFPDEILFMTLDINDTKTRERELMEIALVDQPTGLGNRRAFEAYKNEVVKTTDMVIVSADLNDLKRTNDALGHVAGDELIFAAARILTEVFESYGKIYRVGGDEFLAVLTEASNPEELAAQVKEKCASWTGNYVKNISISIGYVGVKEHPRTDFAKLCMIADERMYVDKEKYYSTTERDRRRG